MVHGYCSISSHAKLVNKTWFLRNDKLKWFKTGGHNINPLGNHIIQESPVFLSNIEDIENYISIATL